MGVLLWLQSNMVMGPTCAPVGAGRMEPGDALQLQAGAASRLPALHVSCWCGPAAGVALLLVPAGWRLRTRLA